MLIEIRPSEGGEDAALFASELAQAVSSYCGAPVETVGTGFTLHCL